MIPNDEELQKILEQVARDAVVAERKSQAAYAAQRMRDYLNRNPDQREAARLYQRLPEVRERANARRRERYRSDPEYKSRVGEIKKRSLSKPGNHEKKIQQQKNWYARKKAEKKEAQNEQDQSTD